MAKILSIDTATEKALVCLGDGNDILSFSQNEDQKSHAAFLQPAIAQMLKKTQLKLSEIDAVAVSNGPGSYTGLRVGLSSAKGIAYALQKPLILLNTLTVMAQNAIIQVKEKNFLIAPMIDARRMEVFTAVYNQNLLELLKPTPLILASDSYSELLQNQKIFFFGSGAQKWNSIIDQENAIFDTIHENSGINVLAQQYFSRNWFADLAYSEPFYLKEFYTPKAVK